VNFKKKKKNTFMHICVNSVLHINTMLSMADDRLCLSSKTPPYKHGVAVHGGYDRFCSLWRMAQNPPCYNAIAEIWRYSSNIWTNFDKYHRKLIKQGN